VVPVTFRAWARVSSTAVSWSTFPGPVCPIPPAAPTVMMIGGEFNTPRRCAQPLGQRFDDFAAGPAQSAGVRFRDSGVAFNNDTDCVTGTRGRLLIISQECCEPFHGCR